MLGAVALLVAVEAALGALNAGVATLAALMLGFFVAFNVLEAMLPSLVSRIAPAQGRGTAIGVYNTTQTLGVFFGGLLGGWVAGHHGAGGVFYLCAGLCALWLAVAAGMRPVPLPGSRAVNGLSNAAL
jgi:MFS family permease